MAPSRGFNVTVAAVSSSASSAQASSTGASSATVASQSTATTSSASSSATSSSSNQGRKESSTPVGAIVGGVIGGVAVLALIVGLLFLWRRKKAARGAGAADQYHGDGQYAYPVEQPKQEYGYNNPPMQQQYAPQELPGNHMPLEADSHPLGQQRK